MSIRIPLLGVSILLLACGRSDRFDPEANNGKVHNDSISISRPTPEESEESARLLKPCALVALDSNWSLQRDPAERIEWRLPNQYGAAAADSVIADADWRGADSSYISLNLHDATSVIGSGVGTDSSVSFVDDGWCSLSVAGRLSPVARFRVMPAGADTLYVASVDATIRSGFGLLATIYARTAEARDQFLAALTTLRIID